METDEQFIERIKQLIIASQATPEQIEAAKDLARLYTLASDMVKQRAVKAPAPASAPIGLDYATVVNALNTYTPPSLPNVSIDNYIRGQFGSTFWLDDYTQTVRREGNAGKILKASPDWKMKPYTQAMTASSADNAAKAALVAKNPLLNIQSESTELKPIDPIRWSGI